MYIIQCSKAFNLLNQDLSSITRKRLHQGGFILKCYTIRTQCPSYRQGVHNIIDVTIHFHFSQLIPSFTPKQLQYMDLS